MSKIESSVTEVSKLLTDLMNKVISVSFSASKILLKSSTSSYSKPSPQQMNHTLLTPTDRVVKLRSLSTKQWRSENLDPTNQGQGSVAHRLFERVVPQEAVFSSANHITRRGDEALESHYEILEDAKQVRTCCRTRLHQFV